MSRSQISKKIRFDVFKRDGFQCSYCGESPPKVVLEVDHIEPVSLGGSNDINNLITACFDCNRGKSGTPLDKIPSKLSDQIEVLKQKEEQLSEYRKFIKKIQNREKRDISDIDKIYNQTFQKYQLSRNFKNTSVKKFLSQLPKHEVEEAMFLASSRIKDPDDAIKYFCGICWKKINSISPESKIKNTWIELSKKYGKGSGYLKLSDLQFLSGKFTHYEIEKMMVEALSKKRKSYWVALMDIANGQF